MREMWPPHVNLRLGVGLSGLPENNPFRERIKSVDQLELRVATKCYHLEQRQQSPQQL